MKKFFLGALVLFCLSIPACQCSDKPEIGPIEGTSQVAPDSVPADLTEALA